MNLRDNYTKEVVVQYDEAGKTQKEISSIVDIPQNTISDFLNRKTHSTWWASKEDSVDTIPVESESRVLRESKVIPIRIQTSTVVKRFPTHIMIPDTQVKPDIDMNYLTWIGEYIAHRKPDVIIHIGDHFDLPSLSSYDRGTKKAEGRRLTGDIEAGIHGMNLLLLPIAELQAAEQVKYGEVRYKPKMVFTIGNHEERLMRHVNANPELDGFVNYSSFKLDENGWEVYDFLEPAVINGVTYCHYMASPMSGKPYGGTAQNVLKHVGESFSMGHKQTLEIATRSLPASGKQQWGIIAGASYPHDEEYKGHQGNKHWRGIIVKHGVDNGDYNPMFVDLKYLENRYGS